MLVIFLIGAALGAVVVDAFWRRYHKGYRTEVEKFLREHGLVDEETVRSLLRHRNDEGRI